MAKGSFYWHFVDRNDLLANMLESWRLTLTSSIAETIKRRAADPKARLAYLLKLSTAQREDVPGGPVEQAIREWAKTSDMARVALSRVDSERLEILSSLYQDLGYRDQAARARAVLFLGYVIGFNVLARDLIGTDLTPERDLASPWLSSLS